jgi:hypothetical protein
VLKEGGGPPTILLAFEDITERRTSADHRGVHFGQAALAVLLKAAAAHELIRHRSVVSIPWLRRKDRRNR